MNRVYYESTTPLISTVEHRAHHVLGPDWLSLAVFPLLFSIFMHSSSTARSVYYKAEGRISDYGTCFTTTYNVHVLSYALTSAVVLFYVNQSLLTGLRPIECTQ